MVFHKTNTTRPSQLLHATVVVRVSEGHERPVGSSGSGSPQNELLEVGEDALPANVVCETLIWGMWGTREEEQTS